MKQEQRHIDEHFRQNLHDASVQPPAFVWSNIEEALQKRRRKRFIFWLWGAGLSGLTAFAVWYGLRPTTPTATLSQTDAVLENSAAPAKSVLPAQSLTFGESAASAKNNPAEKNVASETQTSFAKRATEKRTAAAAPVPLFSYSSELTTRSVDAATEPATAPALQADAPASAANAPVLADEAPLAPELIAQEPAVGQPQAVAAVTPALPVPTWSALDAPPADWRVPASIAAVRAQTPRRKASQTTKCYRFNKKQHVWLLDAYTGPSLPRKSILSLQAEDEAYRRQRVDTERSDWAFNAGLRGSLVFNRNLLLRAGLHYEQFTEIFEYADPNFIEVIIRQEKKLINGAWVTVIDTLDINYGEHYQKTYNRFGLLDIPLETGFEVRSGRSGFSLQGSVSLNVLFWKRGAILAQNGNPVDFSPRANDYTEVFRRRIGLSVGGSVQWFYHLQPRWRIFAEPYIRYSHQPLTTPDYPLQQRYTIGGLRFGMTRILD